MPSTRIDRLVSPNGKILYLSFEQNETFFRLPKKQKAFFFPVSMPVRPERKNLTVLYYIQPNDV